MGKSKSLRMLAVLLILALLLPGLAPMTARAEENPFVDVSEEDYFYDAVLWVLKRKAYVKSDYLRSGRIRYV